MFKMYFILCWIVGAIGSNPGIKVLISDSGLKYAVNHVADVLAKEIVKSRMADIKGWEMFSYGVLNYTFSDIVINGFTRPDIGLQINPPGSISLSFSEASVAATATFLCKKADGVVKFRHSTSVILSVYRVSVFITSTIGLDNDGMPILEATTCSSSIGSTMAIFQGDVNSIYNPIVRSKRFRRHLHTSLGGLVCTLVSKTLNSNGFLNTFNGQALIQEPLIFDLRMTSDLTFGPDYIESSHNGRFLGDIYQEEAPIMFLGPERMLTIGISEASMNSAARMLHNNGILTFVIPDTEFKDMAPKLNVAHQNSEMQVIITSTSPPTFAITSKVILLRIEIEGKLVEVSKNTTILASIQMSIKAHLKPVINYHNLTASFTAFQPTIRDVSENSGGEFLRDFAGNLSEEIQRLGSGLLKIGMPLPRLKGTLYINDHHKLLKRYLSITCDVIYAP